MAESIFNDIRLKAGDAERSYRWFQNQVRNLATATTSRSLMSNTQQLANSIMPGEMYLFFYDPKHKETLPYYDKFPLVLPFREVKDGFYGINLHYMPYMMRFKLLKALSDLTTDDKLDNKTKITISWKILQRFSSIAPLKNIVKHYLYNHVQSRFLKIGYPDWLTASQLPIEMFEKANKTKVWNDTRR